MGLNVISCAAFLLLLFSSTCTAQLSSTFYGTTCPNALSTIRTSIRQAVLAERRMAASLIRLHFHDCFVQGCDGSVLLEDSSSLTSERSATPNLGVRGFGAVQNAKTEVEKICPGVVSCADILAVAARDASVAVGGPSWTVKLGRRDSTTASLSGAQSDLPLAGEDLNTLLGKFSRKGLNAKEMVVLSGAHTIGQAQCVTFRARIYNNASDIDANFARTRQRNCPATGGNGNLAPLDLVTPNSFDNNYYKNLLQKKGLLASDQVLLSGGSTDAFVNQYSQNTATFSSDFAVAMAKMGDIGPLTGSAGQIRRICSAVN
ncbi:hypothetical protein UlMin_041511 [Ulmus minor]